MRAGVKSLVPALVRVHPEGGFRNAHPPSGQVLGGDPRVGTSSGSRRHGAGCLHHLFLRPNPRKVHCNSVRLLDRGRCERTRAGLAVRHFRGHFKEMLMSEGGAPASSTDLVQRDAPSAGTSRSVSRLGASSGILELFILQKCLFDMDLRTEMNKNRTLGDGKPVVQGLCGSTDNKHL